MYLCTRFYYTKDELLNMRYFFHLVILLSTLILTACIKDEPKNMECDILEAWIEGDDLEQYFMQLNDMRISDIPSSASLLTFTVRQRSALPDMPIHFKITPGATIYPENGSKQDFSNGPVTYKVTSEDGQWHRYYTIDFHEATQPSNKYDFDTYELDSKYSKYYVWYSKNEDGTKEYIWATGNEGFMIAKSGVPATDYPTIPDENGIDGSCIRLVTRSTGSWGKTTNKPIAAGNFFLGRFNIKYALTKTLWATEMGIPYTKEPVKVTGFYKYKPGDTFIDKYEHVLPDRVDEPSIYSVLYVNHDEEGNEIMLHGDDVLTSPYIVRKAQVASLPPTDEWQPFEMTFEGTTPIDAEQLANRGYNLALVFSSSKTGDFFEGAEGSTLLIDKLELTFKETDQTQ